MKFVSLHEHAARVYGRRKLLMADQCGPSRSNILAAMLGFWWIGYTDIGDAEIDWAIEAVATDVVRMRQIGLVHGPKAARKYIHKHVCPEDCMLSKTWTLGNGRFMMKAMDDMHKTIIRGKANRQAAGMVNAVDFFAGIEYQQMLNLYKVWQMRERPYFMEVYRRLLRTGYRKFNLGPIPNVR